MDPKIAKLDNDYRELEGKLAAGGLSSSELKELAVRHSQLAPMMAKVRELLRVEGELEGLKAMEADPDLKAMADEERPRLEARRGALSADIAADLLVVGMDQQEQPEERRGRGDGEPDAVGNHPPPMRILAETEGKQKDRNFALPGSGLLCMFVPTGWYRSMADRRRGEPVMAVEVRSAKGAATRDQILDVAGRLIQLRGYHATSLDDVLKASGVGKGNFYYYFKSKEDLGYAILDRMLQAFVERTLDPAFADSVADPVVQIQEFLDRVLDNQRQRSCIGGCPMGNLASELSDVHEGFRQRLAGMFLQWRVTLGEVLARGRESGRLRSGLDPASAAEFLVAALEGAILLTKVTRDISVMERCVTELKQHLTLYEAR